MLEATRTFTEHYPDEKAAVIVTHERALAIDSWIVFLFYDGPTPPQGVFDGLKAVGPEVDTTKTWDTYYDLVCRCGRPTHHGPSLPAVLTSS